MVMVIRCSRLGGAGGSWVFAEGDSVLAGLLLVGKWGLASRQLLFSFTVGAFVVGDRVLAVVAAPFLLLFALLLLNLLG